LNKKKIKLKVYNSTSHVMLNFLTTYFCWHCSGRFS